MSDRSGKRSPEKRFRQNRTAQAGHARARSQGRPKEHKRSGLTLPMRLGIIVLTVGLLGTGAFFITRYFNGSWNVKQAINASISAIEESDEGIVALNELVSSTVDEVTGIDTSNLSENMQVSEEKLNQAEDYLAQASELDEFMDDNQRAICEALRSSIDARRSMISAGEEIVSVDTKVGQARSLLDQTIEKALAADEKSREATQAANEYALYLTGNTETSVTDANVAVNLDNEAIALLGESEGLLASAKEAFGDADYTLYETYLVKRKEAAQLMLDADNAVVSGDFAATSEKTNSYNNADAAAAEAAAALPASTADIFSELYTSITASSRAAYTEAAQKAAEADALIRHYQGVSVSVSEEASTTDDATNLEAVTTDVDNEKASSDTATTEDVNATLTATTATSDDVGGDSNASTSTTNADSVVTVQ